MNDEQRKAVRMALTGQDTDPVELKTTPGGEGLLGGDNGTPNYENGAEHVHKDNGNIELSSEDVLNMIQQLYPVHFNHAVAEVKSQTLLQRLQELS